MTDTLRVLTTGSRTWDRADVINVCLTQIARAAIQDGYHRMTVIHGYAEGSDLLVDAWARRWWDPALPVRAERHPPHYTRFGRRAPLVRNREMVSTGAQLALVFGRTCRARDCRGRDLHLTHGTSHAAYLAEGYDIPTQYVVYPGEEPVG